MTTIAGEGIQQRGCGKEAQGYAWALEEPGGQLAQSPEENPEASALPAIFQHPETVAKGESNGES